MQVTVNEKLILLDLMGKDRETLLGKMADNLCENGFVKNTYKDAILAQTQKTIPPEALKAGEAELDLRKEVAEEEKRVTTKGSSNKK